LNEKTALEHHDSVPEEQERRGAGCDLDHFSLIESASRGSGGSQIPGTGRVIPFSLMDSIEIHAPFSEELAFGAPGAKV
jgi:hypothetical protein